MKSFFKNIFFSVASLLAPPLGERASILMYHSVSDSRDYFSSVPPARFHEQMRHLAEQKIPVVSLVELIRRLREKEDLNGAVAITFDDGYRDNLTNAFPILKQYSFPATIFVSTDLIGAVDKRGMERLSEREIKEMEESELIDIEPHTKSHPKLTQCSGDVLKEEIVGSKEKLEQLLGKQCAFFAYPYGDYNNDVVAVVRENGFAAAVTVNEGTISSGDNIFELKRNSIDRSTSFTQFRGKLRRAVDWYRAIKLCALRNSGAGRLFMEPCAGWRAERPNFS